MKQKTPAPLPNHDQCWLVLHEKQNNFERAQESTPEIPAIQEQNKTSE